jgi:CheY-like chemotaxis protein
MRVLVVEDHAETAAMLAELLRLEKHQVQIAPDGPTALRMAEAAPPDVALVDISLPGMSGHEVARQLRTVTGGKRPLLIAMTGHAQDEYRQRSEDAGVDLHLVKPLQVDDLRRLLRRFWDIIRPGAESSNRPGDGGSRGGS